MPQHNYIERHEKENGKYGGAFQIWDKERKKEARLPKNESKMARTLIGLKAKLYNKKKHAENVQMNKTKKLHQEKEREDRDPQNVPDGAVPAYLLDREGVNRSKILSNTIKQKRKEKAGKWAVPVPKVKAMTEDEMFKIMRSGKRKKKQWKRVIDKVTFVGDNFTRKPPKYERFIRPMALRFTKANVTHPELKTTFLLPIIGVKKNPQNHTFTTLGVITKGTILEVNVSDLGLVTPSGKIVTSKYAQVVNEPSNDGTINCILLV